MVTLQLQQLSVLPGHRVILHDISWQEFEAILEELGTWRPSSHSVGLQPRNFGDENAVTKA